MVILMLTMTPDAAEAEGVGDNAGDERFDRITEVAPETVDTDCRGAPRRQRDVPDGSEERRIDHRSTDT